jgi:hypothetical protein
MERAVDSVWCERAFITSDVLHPSQIAHLPYHLRCACWLLARHSREGPLSRAQVSLFEWRLTLPRNVGVPVVFALHDRP